MDAATLRTEMLAGIGKILHVPFLSDENRKVLTISLKYWAMNDKAVDDLLALYKAVHADH